VSRRELTVELLIVGLLLAAAAMLYLEWWRSGELEFLNGRVQAVEGEVIELRDRATRNGQRGTRAKKTTGEDAT